MAQAIPAALAINGAIQGRKSAKSHNAQIQQQRDDDMRSYEFSEPYIERSYDRGEGALNNSLDQGSYQGKTYADMNGYEESGYDYLGSQGLEQGRNAADIANASKGFANNYQDLYDRRSQDRMGAAQEYALGTSQPLIDAAMRDPTRQFTEQTLPGINRTASGQGNMNSSRAGMAEGIAARGFGDRYADMTATINQQQQDKHLGMQQQQFSDAMRANQGMYNGFSSGMSNIGASGNMMVGAGQGYRNYNQGALNDQRSSFERDRDFALDQEIKYKKGILGQADYTSSSVPVTEKNNVMMDTISGAMGGYAMGSKITGGG
jgi:hypothetical protein